MGKQHQGLKRTIAAHNLNFFGDSPVVFHCHHFNLFLEQTVDDALGASVGWSLRVAAAQEAAYHLLSNVCDRLGVKTPPERLLACQRMFGDMGHGKLELLVGADGGSVDGDFLHYAFTWREKYGDKISRRRPIDAFAAGFSAAAAAVAYDAGPGAFTAQETACYVKREPRCHFEITRAAEVPEYAKVGWDETQRCLRPAFAGKEEERIASIAAGLREFLAGVSADKRGLVQAFGVFVTLHLASYYNALTFGSLRHVQAKVPALVPVLESLLRESGHVCVFNTFGGVLLSPEWEGLVGVPTADPLEIVTSCLAIARALGFGTWTLEDFEPGRRLVLRAPTTYESIYFESRHGQCERGISYFLQGAAVAVMQLAHRVPWGGPVELTDEFYQVLFKTGASWSVNQTRCVACGDGIDEVVVTAD